MKKLTIVILLFVLSILLTSCTQSNKSRFLGVWEADQASQEAGSDVEIGHYNYLEISETTIEAKSFVMVKQQDGSLQKKFSDLHKDMNYEWNTDQQVLIENQPFKIEFKQDEMILQNDVIKIHYNKK
ncbi:hypothetical protein E0485_00875 [Paenibacillus albiflavus]|uniref:Lipocalin-like domain-containing protein n=1 Tax=Paenibacillus albiflavus TaxID=2545760 RepID=A0A4R4EM52_9BACL|nr:hypothetical protein [Paenibacillus albiflavus]TCZ80877.1 hypothetical protein E0485_00875 [Paenibacillus albiflavus]